MSVQKLVLFLDYQICDFTNTATLGWISEQEVPYATYGSSWLGYDDQRSYSSKVNSFDMLQIRQVLVFVLFY